MARIQNQGNNPISVYSDYSGDLDQIAILILITILGY